MSDHATIAGYLAMRHGCVVGLGATREAAARAAASNGMVRAEIVAAGERHMERAAGDLEHRVWHTEVELLRCAFEAAIGGEWAERWYMERPWGDDAESEDAALDTRIDDIMHDLLLAERRDAEAVSQGARALNEDPTCA